MGGKTRNIAIPLVLQQTLGVVLSYISHILVFGQKTDIDFAHVGL